MKIKKSLQNITIVMCTLLIMMLLMEGGGSIRHYLKHQTFSRQYLRALRENWSVDASDQSVGEQPGRWDNVATLHPLFGLVYHRNRVIKFPVNNYGFICPYDFGINAQGYFVEHVSVENPLFVGVFGGSFANLTVLQAGTYLEEQLHNLYPEYQPIVINLAVGGHALPQSWAIFTYFYSMLDLVIFIDGVNEVWNYVNNNHADVPPEYASATNYLYRLSLNALTPERFERTQRILRARANIARVTRFSLQPFLRNLVLTHYLWSRTVLFWENTIRWETHAIQQDFQITEQRFFDLDDPAILHFTATQWGRYHQLIHHIASSNDILDLHALQPNPYIPDSKRYFTEIEQNIMQTDNTNIRVCVQEGYPLLRKQLEQLDQQGILVSDLAYVYYDRDDTMWEDYCHANMLGYHLVVDALIGKLQEHPEVIQAHRNTLNTKKRSALMQDNPLEERVTP